MENRKVKILNILSSANTPITSTQLAAVTEVSSRTIREDIKELNTDLKINGAQIEALKGKGFKITIFNELLYNQYLEQIDHSLDQISNNPNTPNERIDYLLNLFLRKSNPVKLDDLSEEIHVSRSTIQADLKTVKQLLEPYSLKLISRPNYGISLKGTELNRRFAISEFLFNQQKAGPSLIQMQHVSSIAEINELILNNMWSILLEQINRNEIVLSDVALNNLFVHIVIAYKRIKEGYSVALVEKDLSEIQTQKEYKVATKIVQQIEQTLHVTFPTIEIAYIAIHLLGTKLIGESNNSTTQYEQVIDPMIQKLIDQILLQLKKELNLSLLNDQELIMSLALHLKPAINRYKFNMNIRNPMLEDIKAHYPLAFEAGIIAALEIKKALSVEIDENEVAYIALHIGAAMEREKEKHFLKKCYIVCASGVGSSKLIQYKVTAEFRSEIEVVGTTELYRIHEIPYDNIDFIISAVPIKDTLPVPIIEVNTILSHYDLSRIEHFIKDVHSDPIAFIDEDHTYLNQSLKSKQEVFNFLVDKLTPIHALPADYQLLLEKREEIAPTSYGNNVAIPHPITPQTSKTFLTFCTLDQPIIWGERKVQFICLLNVEKDSREDLQLLYDILGKIVNTPAIVAKLLQCSSYNDFISIIQTLANK
ncbi:lichenan operon transcriptional antiterminator [Marinilactibacillus piezotolerans]|uniref:Lichenan operon transcriptional antiterminator n=1 Tax=Marinilactibacillus piezotolerans TaxID=258723 RepID=A0A1I3YPJ8_9LACT|nr:BglG family transcription antiterminator [Marinilactibacillus piezotolerans]SFK33703.1 lichenan operon transcriptional antiterminator [Marinilactibacillus piezotolerans]